MKKYIVGVSYSVLMRTTVEVEATDESEALEKAVEQAATPSDVTLNQFTVEDYQQFELNDDDIFSVEEAEE